MNVAVETMLTSFQRRCNPFEMRVDSKRWMHRWISSESSFSRIVPEDIVSELSYQEPTPLSLQQMRSFSNPDQNLRLVSGQFLHKELQIRFARAISQLGQLPLTLPQTVGVTSAQSLYEQFLIDIMNSKIPECKEDDQKFTELLSDIKRRGSALVPLICRSLHQLKQHDLYKSALNSPDVQDDITKTLDSFFMARIGIRMLIGQHAESLTNPGGRVVTLCPEEVAREAVESASTLCKRRYGWAPEVEITNGGSKMGNFTYVRSHLHHMIFELVKNSMRAVVELSTQKTKEDPPSLHCHNTCQIVGTSHLGFTSGDLPGEGVSIYPATRHRSTRGLAPIRVAISQGAEDIAIKVSDEACGICRSDWPKLWHYTYTTDTKGEVDSLKEETFRDHFSGGGYGLPISRLFARYFGGELSLLSMEGYGTDAFIQLSRLGNKTELIPGNCNTGILPLRY